MCKIAIPRPGKETTSVVGRRSANDIGNKQRDNMRSAVVQVSFISGECSSPEDERRVDPHEDPIPSSM
jgi:hypothetical protein